MPHGQTDSLKCLVLNAGGTYIVNKQEAEAWADAVAGDDERRPDLVFVQEIPSDGWLEAWCKQGYRHILGHPRGWKVRSAILTMLPDDQCFELSSEHMPELEYHGEYVAAARLIGWGPDGADLSVLSVHASPNPTTAEYLSHYPGADTILRRDGGDDPRHHGQLFDADVVLETVARYAPAVLACGDLNEARGWDDLPEHAGHTWGADYFGARNDDGQLAGGSVQARNLFDVPLSADGSEVITRRQQGHPSLQLDHILTSPQLAGQIRGVEVDPNWNSNTETAAGLADHAPIRFTLIGAPSVARDRGSVARTMIATSRPATPMPRRLCDGLLYARQAARNLVMTPHTTHDRSETHRASPLGCAGRKGAS
jgi:hypothetical protein